MSVPVSSDSVSALPEGSRNPLRRVWDHWLHLVHSVGVVQTRFLFVVFYFLVVVPLGVGARLTADRLRLRAPEGTCWVPYVEEERSLAAAQRQF